MLGCLSKKIKNRFKVIQQIYNFVQNDENRAKLINPKSSLNKVLLHMACENKEIKIVRYLNSLPMIKINAVDDDNRTALMTYIFFGFNDISILLLNHPDIDINIHDKNNKTAYDIAVSHCSLDKEIIQLLHDQNNK